MISNVTKKCEHCETPLEFAGPDGVRMVFTAHTDEFCIAATRQLVRLLRSTIGSIHETYAHRIAREYRAIDKILADAGLPTLAERAKHAEVMRLAAELPKAGFSMGYLVKPE